MSDGKFFLIQSYMNDLCLDIQEGNLSEGNPVITWEVNGSDHQLWYVDHVRGIIRSKADDNFVLDVQEGTLVISEYNPDSESQKMSLSGNTVSCSECDGEVLDVADWNEEPGATVCRYEHTDGDNQHWHFNYTAPAYCFIRSVEKDNKVLDLKHADSEEGARVILYKQKDEDNDNQLFFEDSNGFIRSKLNDFVFDTYDDDDLRVRAYDADVPSQRWVKCGNKILHRDTPDRCLQVNKGGLMSKDKVEVSDFTGDDGQRWNFEYV